MIAKTLRYAATLLQSAPTRAFAALALLGLFMMLPTVASAQSCQPHTICQSFFGMHINNVNTPWPTAYFANLRLEGSDVNWWNIEEAPGVYDFYWLDQWLANAVANNVTVTYTFAGVPQFYSSDPQDTVCTFQPGACDPPYDLNYDGSGPDQVFQNFVMALEMHNAELGFPIQNFEAWNEPDINRQWIPTCEKHGGKCPGNEKYAQLLRM